VNIHAYTTARSASGETQPVINTNQAISSFADQTSTSAVSPAPFSSQAVVPGDGLKNALDFLLDNNEIEELEDDSCDSEEHSSMLQKEEEEEDEEEEEEDQESGNSADQEVANKSQDQFSFSSPHLNRESVEDGSEKTGTGDAAEAGHNQSTKSKQSH